VSEHPYKNLPNHCFWRRTHSVSSMDQVDPVVSAPFRVKTNDSVATAGSCFAQHIARHLDACGFGYMVTEKAHPLIPPPVARDHNYGIFTARYGNIYTPRQLLQLFNRAYRLFTPVDDVWTTDDGRYLDPYRPTIEPRGFASKRELELDRERHFKAVRDAFERSTVFVFTFGLTEAFINAADGAVYPICPGVAGGQFDESRHVFKNFSVHEVVADFLEFVDRVREKNSALKFIVTVSPVPLVATAEDRSVITSTAYSKSVLRVACEEIVKARPSVAYFPSFEIVTGNYTRGRYFTDDLRTVSDAGVQHVMTLFMRHFADRAEQKPAKPDGMDSDNREFEQIETALEIICDEELLDKRAKPQATREIRSKKANR
jgi:hypothetical protein